MQNNKTATLTVQDRSAAQPYRAHVKVQLEQVGPAELAEVVLDMPIAFEAAHAALYAALAMLASAASGDRTAVEAGKRYLETLPEAFEKMTVDPKLRLIWPSVAAAGTRHQ